MASSSVEINKKRCIKCVDKKSGGGLFTCDGCQQMFCGQHVSEHRKELNLQLENAMQEHDFIQQESNQSKLDQSILEEINIWERESIEKIKKTADIARIDFQRWQQTAQNQFKKKCNELAENLRIARETDDFSESDLIKWNETLTKLKSMTKVHITEDKLTYINLIKIQQDTDLSANIPIQVNWKSVTNKYSNNMSINRSNTDRSEKVPIRNPARSTKSRDNPDRHTQSECNQQ